MTDMKDYERIGARGKLLNDLLVEWHVDAARSTTKRITNPLNSATKKVDKVRSDIEDRMAGEHPYEEWNTDVFYGDFTEAEADALREWVDEIIEDRTDRHPKHIRRRDQTENSEEADEDR